MVYNTFKKLAKDAYTISNFKKEKAFFFKKQALSNNRYHYRIW